MPRLLVNAPHSVIPDALNYLGYLLAQLLGLSFANDRKIDSARVTLAYRRSLCESWRPSTSKKCHAPSRYRQTQDCRQKLSMLEQENLLLRWHRRNLSSKLSRRHGQTMSFRYTLVTQRQAILTK